MTLYDVVTCSKASLHITLHCTYQTNIVNILIHSGSLNFCILTVEPNQKISAKQQEEALKTANEAFQASQMEKMIWKCLRPIPQ